MRDRRHVAYGSNGEADRLQCAQCRFAPGAGPLDLDVEGAHAVLHRLAAGILGGDLRRVRVDLREPLKPWLPDDDHAIALPWASVIVIIVLLNVALTWAVPEVMFLRSRRRRRGVA